jgi:hypothetical protein
MTKLSPAAQAVFDAYWESPWDQSLQQHEDRLAIAAALRAAADQVVPHEDGPSCEGDEYQEAYELRQFIRHDLLAIAAELEQVANTNTTETTP